MNSIALGIAGLTLSLGGSISYFLVFVYFPELRDFPWLNLPLALLGMVLSLAAVCLSWGESASRGRKAILASTGLLSAAVAVLFCHYIFIYSTRLPAAAGVAAIGAPAPLFRLNDQTGQPVSLQQLQGKAVILIFYRGYW